MIRSFFRDRKEGLKCPFCINIQENRVCSEGQSYNSSIWHVMPQFCNWKSTTVIQSFNADVVVGHSSAHLPYIVGVSHGLSFHVWIIVHGNPSPNQPVPLVSTVIIHCPFLPPPELAAAPPLGASLP